MIIRKNESNLLNVIMMIILGIFLFTGMYLWFYSGAVDSGQGLDDKYLTTYNNVNGSLTNRLNNNINSIKSSMINATEADSTFQSAINGFKGLGYALLLPLNFIATAIEAINVFLTPLDFIPKWVMTLIILAITTLIIMIIIALLKGEQKTV